MSNARSRAALVLGGWSTELERGRHRAQSNTFSYGNWRHGQRHVVNGQHLLAFWFGLRWLTHGSWKGRHHAKANISSYGLCMDSTLDIWKNKHVGIIAVSNVRDAIQMTRSAFDVSIMQ